jgi:hypothetical protein
VPPSSPPSSNPALVNDALVGRLSVRFTGRKEEITLIAKAFEKRRNIPHRYVLFDNQGVGKSQLTYTWANATCLRKQHSYIFWISATTVEKLYQDFVDYSAFSTVTTPTVQGVRLEASLRWLERTKTRQLASCPRQRISGDSGISATESTATKWTWNDVVYHPYGKRCARICKHGWETPWIIEVPLLDIRACSADISTLGRWTLLLERLRRSSWPSVVCPLQFNTPLGT